MPDELNTKIAITFSHLKSCANPRSIKEECAADIAFFYLEHCSHNSYFDTYDVKRYSTVAANSATLPHA
jgi:hypothetical protein